MTFLYILILSFGWGYLGDKFHWPFSAVLVCVVMTIAFACLVARVVEDDRR